MLKAGQSVPALPVTRARAAFKMITALLYFLRSKCIFQALLGDLQSVIF